MTTFDPNAAATKDDGIFGLPHSAQEATVVLIPVPFDATTSYRRGTAQGPQAIFKASKQVDLFDAETGKPYEAGICMLPFPQEVISWNQEASAAADPILAVGGQIHNDSSLQHKLFRVNQISQQMTDWVFEQTKSWLQQDKVVGVVGGDHSVPLGAIQAYGTKYAEFGILHIDAHADLRNSYEGFVQSHASIMNNVLARVPQVTKLVQVGIRDFCEEEQTLIDQSQERVVLHTMSAIRAAQFEGHTFTQVCRRIVAELPEHVYVSFDIDGLDPSLCPNTGTPVPGGLWFQEATHLFATLVRSGRQIIGFDVNEVAPSADEHDEWDGNVGARILYKLIGYALLSKHT